MKSDWQNILWLSGAFLVLFGMAEILYHTFRIKAELTRKFVHVFTGVLTLLFPVFLESHWSVLVLCTSFGVLLLLSLRFGWLSSINAIDRQSSGSLLYPVSVYLCFIFYQHNHYHLMYFYLPMLTLAVCDPLAALAGKRWPLRKFKVTGGHKSLMGCAVFFVSSTVLTLSLYACLENVLPWNSEIFSIVLAVSVCSTVAEALSGNGWDNLSIPLAVMGVQGLMLNA